MQWNREFDTLSPFPINLDPNCQTKKQILSTLNAVYDLLNVYGPILNRAKIFLHWLQCDKSVDWDSKLQPDLVKEWSLICRQANDTPAIAVDRFIGSRSGRYNLVAFSDASSVSYGVVIYIVEIETAKVSFLQAKNRIVNTKLTKKSIPSLECQAIAFAAEVLEDTWRELGPERNDSPININQLFVYSDSMMCLSWINASFSTHEKMQKRKTFVQNRLKYIGELCHSKPMIFRYIEGKDNPADCISRPFTYRKLCSTSYLTGPDFLRDMPSQPDIEVYVSPAVDVNTLQPPSTEVKKDVSFHTIISQSMHTALAPPPQRLDPENFSSLPKLLRIYELILKYVSNLKKAACKRKGEPCCESEGVNLTAKATNLFLRTEQALFYPEIIRFYQSRNINSSKIPSLVLQMNLFLDENSVIRVKCKLKDKTNCPILIPSCSHASTLIVRNVHERNMHAGLYSTLSELRKSFWLPRGFSSVRSILKQCLICKRLNERPLKLNQNCYRDFRLSPSKVPFLRIFLDYIGPINVRFEGKVNKVWLLIITCLWSRAVSLRICFSADTSEFLRALQLHIFNFGLFETCVSDLGSQIVSGSNLIVSFLNDLECAEYFQSNGIKGVSFDQYPKGNSSLGSV